MDEDEDDDEDDVCPSSCSSLVSSSSSSSHISFLDKQCLYCICSVGSHTVNKPFFHLRIGLLHTCVQETVSEVKTFLCCQHPKMLLLQNKQTSNCDSQQTFNSTAATFNVFLQLHFGFLDVCNSCDFQVNFVCFLWHIKQFSFLLAALNLFWPFLKYFCFCFLSM